MSGSKLLSTLWKAGIFLNNAKAIVNIAFPQPRSQGLSSLPPLEAEKRDPGNEVEHFHTFGATVEAEIADSSISSMHRLATTGLTG